MVSIMEKAKYALKRLMMVWEHVDRWRQFASSRNSSVISYSCRSDRRIRLTRIVNAYDRIYSRLILSVQCVCMCINFSPRKLMNMARLRRCMPCIGQSRITLKPVKTKLPFNMPLYDITRSFLNISGFIYMF